MPLTAPKPRPTVRGVLRSSHPRSMRIDSTGDAAPEQPPPVIAELATIPTVASADSGGSPEAQAQDLARWESEGGSRSVPGSRT